MYSTHQESISLIKKLKNVMYEERVSMQKIHLKSPGNWINDPNGFIYYKGKYHLFYQYFPYEPRWGTMHWGHAISSDLTNWEHKGIALYPSKFDDKNGCFSGSAIEHDGKLYIYYTGVRYLESNPQDIHRCLNDKFVAAQMMITSEDGFKFDNMNDKKTIIPPIEDENIGCITHTRDPKVWRGKDAWYLMVGSRTAQNNGQLLFYRSNDLNNWEYVNSVSKKGFGWMWECPDYFKVDDEEILVFSPMNISDKEYCNLSVCTTVKFNEESCEMDIPDKYQMLDYGSDLYAPQSTVDADGRRVLVAWARMPEPVDGKWSGMFCIPRVVEVRNGHICFKVHPNIQKQYSRMITSVEEADEAGYHISIDMNNCDCIDIGGYIITCKGDKIFTDRSKVFRGHDEIRSSFETPEIKGKIHLDIYVDNNLIETYINDGEYVISNVVYDLGGHLIVHSGNKPELYTLQ